MNKNVFWLKITINKVFAVKIFKDQYDLRSVELCPSYVEMSKRLDNFE